MLLVFVAPFSTLKSAPWCFPLLWSTASSKDRHHKFLYLQILMRNMTHALIRGSFFLKVNLAHVIRKNNLLPVLLVRPHPSQKLRNIDLVLRSETIFMMNKTRYLHRVSDLDPNFRSYITVDFQDHPYIFSQIHSFTIRVSPPYPETPFHWRTRAEWLH